jgi:BolA protein
MIVPEGDLQLHDATLHLLHSAAMQFARVATAVAAGDATPELLEARQQELQVAACAFAEVLQGGVLADPAPMPQAEMLPPELSAALQERLHPASLSVVDESHQHIGHAGWREGGETHFRLDIVSAAFEGKSRVERHRMINSALAAELAGNVHALAIHAQAPGEG